ncbi:vacuolar protein sorting-associated protein 54-like [Amphibalanus amphitrite]|uniref:vacuolar protein sorting-associated protein 54-like n=1 Tax=Amphibalanus amphitrite TaxID=1232801 RepID=UPI001C91C8CF|nr:vacuolar protein sorting-associated protein 54-like [Amphibalanus amphitrite]
MLSKPTPACTRSQALVPGRSRSHLLYLCVVPPSTPPPPCARPQALVPDRSRSQLRHLDQVELDYRAHLSEIDSKLVLIISSACDAQLNKWEARPPVPSQQFRAVCRAVSKLHEATSGVLTAEHSHRLFTRMNAAFVESLRRRVVKLNIKSDGGPQHGLVTSELLFYQEHLKTLQFVPDRPFAEQLWSPDKPAAAS